MVLGGWQPGLCFFSELCADGPPWIPLGAVVKREGKQLVLQLVLPPKRLGLCVASPSFSTQSPAPLKEKGPLFLVACERDATLDRSPVVIRGRERKEGRGSAYGWAGC